DHSKELSMVGGGRTASYRIHTSTAMVSTVTRSVPIKYWCECNQLSSGAVNWERNGAAVGSCTVPEDSQSRHSLRPSETGKPHASQVPIFPRSPVRTT